MPSLRDADAGDADAGTAPGAPRKVRPGGGPLVGACGSSTLVDKHGSANEGSTLGNGGERIASPSKSAATSKASGRKEARAGKSGEAATLRSPNQPTKGPSADGVEKADSGVSSPATMAASESKQPPNRPPPKDLRFNALALVPLTVPVPYNADDLGPTLQCLSGLSSTAVAGAHARFFDPDLDNLQNTVDGPIRIKAGAILGRPQVMSKAVENFVHIGIPRGASGISRKHVKIVKVVPGSTPAQDGNAAKPTVLVRATHEYGVMLFYNQLGKWKSVWLGEGEEKTMNLGDVISFEWADKTQGKKLQQLYYCVVGLVYGRGSGEVSNCAGDKQTGQPTKRSSSHANDSEHSTDEAPKLGHSDAAKPAACSASKTPSSSSMYAAAPTTSKKMASSARGEGKPNSVLTKMREKAAAGKDAENSATAAASAMKPARATAKPIVRNGSMASSSIPADAKLTPQANSQPGLEASALTSKRDPANQPETVKPLSPPQSYEMTDSDLDSSESDSSLDDNRLEWERKANLKLALKQQYRRDPDPIFGDVVFTCNLEKVLDQKKANPRSSSANWVKDGLHPFEKQIYRRDMGYALKDRGFDALSSTAKATKLGHSDASKPTASSASKPPSSSSSGRKKRSDDFSFGDVNDGYDDLGASQKNGGDESDGTRKSQDDGRAEDLKSPPEAALGQHVSAAAKAVAPPGLAAYRTKRKASPGSVVGSPLPKSSRAGSPSAGKTVPAKDGSTLPREENAEPEKVPARNSRSANNPQNSPISSTRRIVRRSTRRKKPGKFAISPATDELLQTMHMTHEGAFDPSRVDFGLWNFSHLDSAVSTILAKCPDSDLFLYSGVEEFRGEGGQLCEAPYVVGIVVPRGHTPSGFAAQYNGSEVTPRSFADLGYRWSDAGWGGRVKCLVLGDTDGDIPSGLHRHSDVYSLMPGDLERREGNLLVDAVSYAIKNGENDVKITWTPGEEAMKNHVQSVMKQYYDVNAESNSKDSQQAKKHVLEAVRSGLDRARTEKQEQINAFCKAAQTTEVAFKAFALVKLLPVNFPGKITGTLTNKMHDANGVDVVVCDHHSLTIPKLIDASRGDFGPRSLAIPALIRGVPQSVDRFLNAGDSSLAPVVECLGQIVLVDLLVRTEYTDIDCDQIVKTFGVARILQHFGLCLSDMQCDEGRVRSYLTSIEKKLSSTFAQKTGRPPRPASTLDFIVSFPLFKSPPPERPALGSNKAGRLLGFDRDSHMLTIALFGDVVTDDYGNERPIVHPIGPAGVMDFVLKEEVTELILTLLSQPKNGTIVIPSGAKDDPATGDEDTDCFKQALLNLPKDYLSSEWMEIVREAFPDGRTPLGARFDLVRKYVKPIFLKRVVGADLHQTAIHGAEVMIAEVTSGRYTHCVVIDGHSNSVIDPALEPVQSFRRTRNSVREMLGVGKGESFVAIYTVKKHPAPSSKTLAKVQRKLLGRTCKDGEADAEEETPQKKEGDKKPAAEEETPQHNQQANTGNDDPKTWSKSKKKRMKKKQKKQAAVEGGGSGCLAGVNVGE